MTKRRYYSDDDFEVGVTASQLKRLSRARQLEYILYWFGRNFEDPANQTPHDSAEGGYQYIWGGPYDAQEALATEFGEFISEEVLNEVVANVEEAGIIDWAPGPDHQDHIRAREEWDAEQQPDFVPDLNEIVRNIEAGTQVRFGESDELAERRVILERIAALEHALRKLQPPHGGIGHNNPPTDDVSAIEKSAEIAKATNIIKAELNKKKPDALAVGRSAQSLKGVLKWAAAKADMAFNAFIKALAGGFGLSVSVNIKEIWAEVLQGVHSIITTVTNWLSSISTTL